MSPIDHQPGREGAPTVREIAEFTARLRELSARGTSADPAERAAFLADKHALIARITAHDDMNADDERSTRQDHPTQTVPSCLVTTDEQESRSEQQLSRWHTDDSDRGTAADGDHHGHEVANSPGSRSFVVDGSEQS